MLKAYKYRLYPNLEQREYLVKTFGCTRFIYNKMLADKIEYYKETGEMLKNTPAQYKKEFEWLKEVDSLALANAQQNLEKAYKNFFRDKSIGFPKFKSKKTNYYSYTTNNQKGTVYIENNHVKIPKLKTMIKIKYHREFTGVIKSCTISKTPSNKYFISINKSKYILISVFLSSLSMFIFYKYNFFNNTLFNLAYSFLIFYIINFLIYVILKTFYKETK